MAGVPVYLNEGGGDKVLGVTDAAEAFKFLAAIESASAPGGSDYGWLGVATHVEDDAVTSPGGFTTTKAPLVLVGGDAAGNAKPLQIGEDTAAAALRVVLASDDPAVELLTTIDADANAIKIAVERLDNAVDGDYLDVNLNIAGVDVAAGTGADNAQVQRVILADTDPAVVKLGTIDTNTGNMVTALQLIDDPVFADNAPFTLTSSKVTMAGAFVEDVLGGAGAAEADAVPLRVNANGALHVTGGGGGTEYIDDTSTHATGASVGNLLMAAATPTDPAVDANDIGAVAMSLDRRLYVDAWLAGTDDVSLDVSGAALEIGTISDTDFAVADGNPLGVGVLIQGDDGGDRKNIHVDDATGDVQVDVTEVVPGTAATNLGKAESVSHDSGDVGVMALAVRNDGGGALAGDGEYIPLMVNSAGALYATGGTEYTVDVAAPAAPVGGAGLMERDDVIAALDEIEGDWTNMRATAEGALWVQDFNSDAILAALAGALTVSAHHVTNAGAFAVQIADPSFAVADGNALGEGVLIQGDDGGDRKNIHVDDATGDVQVDVTEVVPGVAAASLGKAEDAAHASGDTGVMMLAVRHNTISALAGADGDYIPLTTDTDGRLYVNVSDGGGALTVDGTIVAGNTAGDAAHAAADTGNPVKLGGRAQEPTAQPDEVTDEDRVDALFDRNGYQRVRGDFNPLSAAIKLDTGATGEGTNEIIAAAGAGKCIAVWAILIVSDGTSDVRFEDGDGGAAFTGQVPLQAREGYTISAGGLVPLWVGSAATNLNLELSADIGQHGFVSYTIMDD